MEENILNSEMISDERAKSSFNSEEIINKRKEKIISFFKNKQIWVWVGLLFLVILGIYIRSLPMTDHNGNPGLWDITTDSWTLGPDLDPWLFTRYAETIVKNRSLPKIDMMRNVPLGFDTSIETQLLPYMIVWTYDALNLLGINKGVIYAAALFPVIMFVLTILSFFLFVREIFIEKDKKNTKANILALISTLFMIVVPVFLSRTVAGIPEKESAAFFFMFLSFYLFLKSWNVEKNRKSFILAVLAGISTALMGLIWGGVIYVVIPIAMSVLISLVINQVTKKHLIVYGLWFIAAFIIMNLFSSKFSIISLFTSLNTILAPIIFFVLLIHFILWKTKLAEKEFIKKIKLPKPILSLILAILLGIILVSVLFGPNFIIEKLKAIHQTIFQPIIGRWNTTVAENKQPFFNEWEGSFGPHLKGIALMFWLFFIGSIFLFKKMLNKLKNKDSWILTGAYILFLIGMVFSRYSSTSIFNGESFISKLTYYGTAFVFVALSLKIYSKYDRENNEAFKSIKFEYLVLFSLFLLAIFSARGAVRLIMVLGPIVPIFASFLILDSFEKWKKNKDEIFKTLWLVFFILVLLTLVVILFGVPGQINGYYQEIKSTSYNYIPSYYNQQWQKAMDWVRINTPENAVFAHWWDYGYWVQSIGNRATVLDGGNAITFWNYYMGRLVLTGDNQKDSLEFLYNHNATHLLIDSTDISKYGAFSIIGSNEDYDKYSWISAFLIDEKQTQETKNETLYVYPGGFVLDEDTLLEDGTFLPAGKTGIIAIILPLEDKGGILKVNPPYIIATYQGKQYKINLKYASVNEGFMEFDSGIEGCAYFMPRIISDSQGRISQNPMGAAMFLSPRVMRGYLAQEYILNDPFNNFPNFKLVHSETNLIINELNSQGMDLPDFIYFNGVQGPIKIWEIEYTGNEKIKPEYLDTDPSKYLSWKL
ncbi:MAG: STT3 domain-containing protein [Candidatus Pacearchaeota archaeon]